jgi:serine/threonine protein kinase
VLEKNMGDHDTQNLIGQTLDRKYKINSLLGEGGMGCVYRGEHVHLKRPCAIKVVSRHHTADPVALKRFQLEAEAASILKHPNIIEIYDFGITEDDLAYIVMEFLPGESLDDVLERHRYLHYEQAILVFFQVCDALAHAHSRKVLHRDLKPGNIMVFNSEGGDLQVKLVDFGIAKLLPGTGRSVEKLTQTGEVFGSPMYMSPEQCMGQSLDFRSDIYALGCVLYQTLTGKLPFVGDNFVQVVVQHIQELPPSFAEVSPDIAIPDELERITFKCLAKDRAQRFDSVLDLRKCLVEIYTSRQFKNTMQATGKMSPEDAGNLAAEPDVEVSEPLSEADLLSRIEQLEEQYGKKCHQLISPLRNLFGLYRDSGEFSEALEAGLQLLALVCDANGEESEEAAFVHEDLGNVYLELGKYSRAEASFRESLSLKIKCLGSETRQACKARIDLANALAKRERIDEAADLVEDAVVKIKRSTGSKSQDTAAIERMAGDFYYYAGDRNKGYLHFEAAFKIVRELYGETDLDLRGYIMDMARCRYFADRFQEAIALSLQAVEIARANPQVFDIQVEHPWTILGWSYHKLGLLDKAEHAFVKSIQIIEELGEERPHYLAASYDSLAEIYDDMGETKLAIACRKRSEEIEPK